jgi:hypothetical protein
MYKRLLFLFIILGSLSKLIGQFNIKVGYNTQFPALKTTNALFTQFNSNGNVTTPYKKFRFMHGLDIGTRYFISKGLAAELGYTYNFTSDNKSTITSGTTLKNDEWRLGNRNISLGLDSYFGWLGLGGHLMYSQWTYSKDVEGQSSKQKVLGTNDYLLKINAIIYSESNKTAIALKPFYTFPLSSKGKDIQSVNKTLNPTSTSTPQLENFQHFGLSIVFYNGPQRS